MMAGGHENWALIIVDVQNDFMEGGALQVSQASTILDPIDELLNAPRIRLVAATQDTHPPAHLSFASTHCKQPFTRHNVPHPYLPNEHIEQMLWPDHCVRDTMGFQFHPRIQQALKRRADAHIISKGTNIKVDGYSGFADNAYLSFTELPRLLFENRITRVVVVGLATDYCVKATTIDAAKFGLKPVVVRQATRGVDEQDCQQALREMSQYGAEIVHSAKDVIALMP
ncbi:Pyrazinamidase/nicotinamidase PNC1 [Ceraceosorus bombacis]|uniref:nicotinamidase n=1 Tax=Ceraceosorus bombacis TaxID=401625 RepID=A0A0P1B936_9BASI|nr:Pyrazinamidase/nicotinamidase PNC1 [Ceraceosorus bombacis]